MFTGLIQAIGRITGVAARPEGILRLEVDLGAWGHRAELGESIAIQGCCLTLAESVDWNRPDARLAFDVVPETLAKTTLGSLDVGAPVNMERSMRASDLVGGHFVQGHVEGVGSVARVQRGDDWRVRIDVPDVLAPAITPKGSIAVDGVSLTVAGVDLAGGIASFEVALIPTTLRLTTLGALREGYRVNLETDMIARSVLHYARHLGRWGFSPGTIARTE